MKVAYGQGADPASTLFARYAIAAIAIGAALGYRRRLEIPTRGLKLGVALALVNVGSSLAFWTALKTGQVTEVAPIVYMYPLIVTAATCVAGRVWPSRRLVAALILGGIGSTLVVTQGLAAPPSSIVALAVVSAAGIAAYYAFAGQLLAHWDPMSAAFLVFSIGCLALVPVLAATPLHSPTTLGWVAVVTLGLFGTAVPTVLLLRGIRLLGSAYAALTSIAEPTVAVVLSLMLLHEAMTIAQGCGVLLTVLALGVLHARAPAAVRL